MNIFSNKFINIFSLLISIIFFIIINFFINNFEINNFNFEENNLVYNNEDFNNQEINTNTLEEIKENEFNWYIKIDKINLYAPINETVDMKVLENNVGHFEETSKTNGNIGLAGHNSGYINNYFKDLNKLKIGDEIIYKYNDYKNNYIINTIKIIKNTNWDYLEKSNENKITLITCIKGQAENRLCIQGIEK